MKDTFYTNSLHSFLITIRWKEYEKRGFGPKIMIQKVLQFVENLGTKQTACPSRTSGCINIHFRLLAKNRDRNEQKINTEISKILIMKISIKYKKKLQKRKTLEAYEIDPKISILSNKKLIRNGKVAELQQKKRSQKRSPSVKKIHALS